MKKWIVAAFLITCSLAHSQAWTPFLDPSRAINFTSAGFSIPNYTVACPTPVGTLGSGSGSASSNTTKIQTALNSCDSTHNVVSIPAGTYYTAGLKYGTQGNQVLRGAGPNSTTLNFTGGNGCAGGLNEGLCMRDATAYYNGSSQVQPGGSNACLWSSGFTQGTTSIGLTACGSTPPVNQTIILDQANDTSDTNGVYICDTNIANCGYEGSTGGNNNGRFISGVTHSQQQVVVVTGITSLGGGAYTVTISPGVYFTNIRTGKAAGAWWPGFVQNDGVENMTLNGAGLDSTIGMYDCYQCWVKNVRAETSGRNAVDFYQSANDVVRDSYFYASQGSASESYSMEFSEASGVLVENNIFQQVTTPWIFGAGTGSVIDYNFSIDVNYSCGGGCPTYANGGYVSHNAGNEMNLFEGNSVFGLWGDDAWGASDQDTYFRNLMQAYQNGKTASTFPNLLRSFVRNINVVGNVMGQTGYHTQYQAIATTTSTGTGQAAEDTSIYSIGFAGTGATCSSGAVTQCDPLSGTTLMRWGNYDTVNATTRWVSSEAAAVANTYVNANFSSSYFNTLAQTLPASLYYGSTPSWWPGGKNWPAIGPDVTTGNVGYCSSGTYAKAQATASGQCSGGGLTTGWASHATSIPAEDCYLSTMGGPPDGTGSVLSFDANTCYSASPTFSWTQNISGTGTVSGLNASSGNYASGTTIGPLTATVGTGYSFGSWSAVSGSAACSGATNPCASFSLSANSAATANFTANSYLISNGTSGSGTGTITGCAGSHVFNTAYTCTVTPTGGSSLVSVSGCGGSGTTTYTGNMPAANCFVTATFLAPTPVSTGSSLIVVQ